MPMLAIKQMVLPSAVVALTPIRSVIIMSIRKLSMLGFQTHTYKYVFNHSESTIFLRTCMHANIQSPRVWKNTQDLIFQNLAVLLPLSAHAASASAARGTSPVPVS